MPISTAPQIDSIPTDPDAALQGQRGQATAEYALVIVGAATIAALLIAWAAGTGTIGRLLDAVLESVIGRI